MIASKFRKALEESGLNQKELSEKIGVTRANISFYLKGTTKPNNETIKKIADVLGKSVEWLTTETIETGVRVSINEAAKMLGLSVNTLKVALRKNHFKEFGEAILTSSEYTYYINRKRLTLYLEGKL